MLDIAKLQKSLGPHASKYSEADLITIRHEIYQFAYFAYNFYYKHKKNKNTNKHWKNTNIC